MNSDPVLGCRTIFWEDGVVRMIDQRLLPSTFKMVTCATIEQVYEAIQNMTVRGAPAIGVAGAFGMVLAVKEKKPRNLEELNAVLQHSKQYLDKARPTAYNLMWATNRIVAEVQDIAEQNYEEYLLECAQRIADEDVLTNKKMAQFGDSLIPFGANIIHHCNTGALATVDIGTALGVIYESHKQGKSIHVWVDETRPRLQGARLTAWELGRCGVPYSLLVDGASGLLMRTHAIDCVLFGADRIAANGDVTNKIGTYNLAVVAHENHVPVYAVAPTSTVDLSNLEGNLASIEYRRKEELLYVNDTPIAPECAEVYNPAFDITPHRYITAIVTEKGICYPPFEESLKRVMSLE